MLPSERGKGEKCPFSLQQVQERNAFCKCFCKGNPSMRCTQRACKRKGLQPSASAMRSAFCKQAREFLQQCTQRALGLFPQERGGPWPFFLKQGFPQERGIPQCSLSGEKGLRERVPLCALREKERESASVRRERETQRKTFRLRPARIPQLNPLSK